MLKNVFDNKLRSAAIMALLALVVSVGHANAQLTQGDFLCTYGANYNVVWDGWKGLLTLSPPGYPDYLPKGQLATGGRTFGVRYQILANPQDYIAGMRAPGYVGVNSTASHRIVFWVDFNNTPGYAGDDQRFDGYMMTQTRNAIAGVTWWNGIPFGFYTTNKLCVVG